MRTLASLQSPWLGLGIAAAITAAGVLAWLLVPNGVLMTWLSEEGPIEQASALLYFVAALALLLSRRGAPLPTWLALIAVSLAFGMRELELHKQLSGGTSMLRLSYYASDAPALARLVAAAALLLVLAALLYLLLRQARPTWRGARAGEPVRATALTFVAVIVVSKLIDRSLNVATDWFGVGWSPSAFALQAAIEEPMESSLPLLLLLGLWQYRAGAQPGGSAKAVNTPV